MSLFLILFSTMKFKREMCYTKLILFADLGSNNSGFYELQAVLTHKGRSSSSGHYVAWVKKKGGKQGLWDCLQNVQYTFINRGWRQYAFVMWCIFEGLTKHILTEIPIKKCSFMLWLCNKMGIPVYWNTRSFMKNTIVICFFEYRYIGNHFQAKLKIFSLKWLKCFCDQIQIPSEQGSHVSTSFLCLTCSRSLLTYSSKFFCLKSILKSM